MRPAFCFHIDFCNILAHNSQTKQLDASDKNNDANQGRPSAYRIIDHQLSHNQINQHYKRKRCHADAKP